MHVFCVFGSLFGGSLLPGSPLIQGTYEMMPQQPIWGQLLGSGGIMLDQSVWSITALTWGTVNLSSQVLTCWEKKLAHKHHCKLINSWRLMNWPTCMLFLRTHGPRALSSQGLPFSPLILSFIHRLFSSFLRKTYTKGNRQQGERRRERRKRMVLFRVLPTSSVETWGSESKGKTVP